MTLMSGLPQAAQRYPAGGLKPLLGSLDVENIAGIYSKQRDFIGFNGDFMVSKADFMRFNDVQWNFMDFKQQIWWYKANLMGI